MRGKTVGELAEAIARPEPGPAGVAVSALAGAFAMDLLVKILTIRKAGTEMIARARGVAEDLRGAAEQDADAVRANDRSAMMQAPLRAARALIKGIALCRSAAPVVTRGHIAADREAAQSVLLGAARGVLVCLDANVKLWPEEAASREVAELWAVLEGFVSDQR